MPSTGSEAGILSVKVHYLCVAMRTDHFGALGGDRRGYILRARSRASGECYG
jgi:hypothetical protein